MLLGQLIINILIAASTYTLVALSFAVIYDTARFFHFAHAGILAFAAYQIYIFEIECGLPVLLSVLLSAGTSAGLGVLLELIVYRWLHRRRAKGLVLLLVSLGLLAVIEGVLSLIFGSGTKSVIAASMVLSVNGARITGTQSAMITVTVLIVLVLWLGSRTTQFGRILRAVADDADLASFMGVNIDCVVLSAFTIGSALVAIAAFFLAHESAITPTMGFNPLLLGMVAMLLGKKLGVVGIASGSIIIASLQHIATLTLAPGWQDLGAYLLLILILLLGSSRRVMTKSKLAGV